MLSVMRAIQVKAIQDHRRASHCTACGRAGVAYEYEGICFDGLINFKDGRLCPPCGDRRIGEGASILMLPSAYRIEDLRG